MTTSPQAVDLGDTLLAGGGDTPDSADALVAYLAGGGDTDTNAAVAGGVLGARYGGSSIPARWLAYIP